MSRVKHQSSLFILHNRIFCPPLGIFVPLVGQNILGYSVPPLNNISWPIAPIASWFQGASGIYGGRRGGMIAVGTRLGREEKSRS